MDFLIGIHDMLYAKMGVVLYYVLFLMVVVGAMAQYRLYTKAGQPGYTALVPVLNVIVFLKIVGRPAKDGWKFLIPVWGQFYFLPKVWIEVCKSFGKTSTLDYVLVIVLNGLYILNLALDEDTRYMGPLYGQKAPPPPRKLSHDPSPSLA
ncbi:MAG: hypothetical protein IPO05_02805 [Flavobacteriales bacterium]|nr:hypothetical protein [Flavobacteriales bacterium]MBK9512560.1 hypothetical protein [Flavobacteriales bacterium]MBP7450212.1 hypothetical protein [Flavobacteriales bacterium]